MPRTRWHITFGTYAARIHGGPRPTVDRRQNKVGQDSIINERALELHRGALATHTPLELTSEQRAFVEQALPSICLRADCTLVAAAAAPDHIHIVIEADQHLHGKQARAWIKRWLSEALNERWSDRKNEGARWWAEGGSARAVHGRDYREAAESYVHKQRTS